MLNKLLLSIVCLLLVGSAHSQVVIPEFKSNVADNNNRPFTSGVKNYDLLIAYRAYSNWSHEVVYNVLLLKEGHWKKLIYKLSNRNVLTAKPKVTEKPSTDAECYLLYQKLLKNHLFTVADDSTIPKCDTRKMIVNGKEETVVESINDGEEYSFFIMQPSKMRQLHYYAPATFAKNCPSEKNRQDALKLIALFDKEW